MVVGSAGMKRAGGRNTSSASESAAARSEPPSMQRPEGDRCVALMPRKRNCTG